jgi:hypothetical protein
VGHHKNGYLNPAHDHPLELQVKRSLKLPRRENISRFRLNCCALLTCDADFKSARAVCWVTPIASNLMFPAIFQVDSYIIQSSPPCNASQWRVQPPSIPPQPRNSTATHHPALHNALHSASPAAPTAHPCRFHFGQSIRPSVVLLW